MNTELELQKNLQIKISAYFKLDVSRLNAIV